MKLFLKLSIVALTLVLLSIQTVHASRTKSLRNDKKRNKNNKHEHRRAQVFTDSTTISVSNCEHCHVDATCIAEPDEPGRFQCSCSLGYNGDGRQCSDRDECLQDEPCSAIGGFCVDHFPWEGRYTCGCLLGFDPVAFDQDMGHPTQCVSNSKCDLGTDDCDPNIGVCTAHLDGSFTCSCPVNYVMDANSRLCTPVDTDTTSGGTGDGTGNNNGTTSNGDKNNTSSETDHALLCLAKNCDTAKSECSIKPDGSATCLCKYGFFKIGENGACNDKKECSTDDHGCHANAVCYDLEGGHLCICATGYIGDGSTMCSDQDECSLAENPCGGEMCVNTIGSYYCQAFPSASPSMASESPSGSPTSGPTRRYVPSWRQIEDDIIGDDNYDFFGTSVAMSDDGTVVAAGAPGYGYVRVFDLTSDGWTLRGPRILNSISDHEDRDSAAGTSFAMSGDGDTIVMGAPDYGIDSYCNATFEVTGAATIHQWNAGMDEWDEVQIIEGDQHWEELGAAVAMSSDGNVLAIGSPYYFDLDTNETVGRVQVYKKNSGMTPLYELKTEIVGSDTGGHHFGHSLDLSSTGNVLIIGGVEHTDSCCNSDGIIKVYDYDLDTVLTQRGSNIIGDESNNEFGHSVAISANGNVFAAGAPYNDSFRGRVKVYAWSAAAGEWVQRGSDINGEEEDDEFGWSVDLSGNGATVVIGAPYNEVLSADGGLVFGHVRVYKWNGKIWYQSGQDFDGNYYDDEFGYSVAMSYDGNRFVAGSPYTSNFECGSEEGDIRVFRYY